MGDFKGAPDLCPIKQTRRHLKNFIYDLLSKRPMRLDWGNKDLTYMGMKHTT